MKNPEELRRAAIVAVLDADLLHTGSSRAQMAGVAVDAAMRVYGPGIANAIEAAMTGPGDKPRRADRMRTDLAKLRGTIRALGQPAPAATE